MTISPSLIGTATPPLTVTVDRGRLRLFAKATGQTDPLYVDVTVARSQGHPDLPVPPTFLFGLELEQPEPFGWITALGVDMNAVLHGTQSFAYETLAYAGDTLTVQSTVTDVYSRKSGALEFVERSTAVTRDGVTLGTCSQTIVVRSAA